ncbi:MAG: hypothetical protein AAF541_06690 [Pseudomonadota bacterium]
MKLQAEFKNLEQLVHELLGLLNEADETFWKRYLERGVEKIKRRELAGATYVLGCYNGEGSFSDLTIAEALKETQPLDHKNLNARLGQLRTEIFTSANKIASRKLW